MHSRSRRRARIICRSSSRRSLVRQAHLDGAARRPVGGDDLHHRGVAGGDVAAAHAGFTSGNGVDESIYTAAPWFRPRSCASTSCSRPSRRGAGAVGAIHRRGRSARGPDPVRGPRHAGRPRVRPSHRRGRRAREGHRRRLLRLSERTRLRVLAGLIAFRRLRRSRAPRRSFRPRDAPAPDGSTGRAARTRADRRVMQSPWHVPVRWFVLFDDQSAGSRPDAPSPVLPDDDAEGRPPRGARDPDPAADGARTDRGSSWSSTSGCRCSTWARCSSSKYGGLCDLRRGTRWTTTTRPRDRGSAQGAVGPGVHEVRGAVPVGAPGSNELGTHESTLRPGAHRRAVARGRSNCRHRGFQPRALPSELPGRTGRRPGRNPSKPSTELVKCSELGGRWLGAALPAWRVRQERPDPSRGCRRSAGSRRRFGASAAPYLVNTRTAQEAVTAAGGDGSYQHEGISTSGGRIDGGRVIGILPCRLPSAGWPSARSPSSR